MGQYTSVLNQLHPTTGRIIKEDGDTFNLATMWFDVYDTTNNVIKTSATISGDVNVDSTSIDTSGYVGKASGTNADFTTAYTAGTTLTVSSLPTEVAALTADDIVTVVQIATDGSVTNTYTRDDAAITVSGAVITVVGATFIGTDTFVVYTNIQRLTQSLEYDLATDSAKQFNIADLSTRQTLVSLVDTTNVTAATHDYTGVMDRGKSLSLSGKFIDADGTLTMKVYMMNDEDTATGDWVQVYGYDDKNNITTNSWTVTNGTLTFAISFNSANYKHFKVEVVADGATNTVIIKSRKVAL